MECAADTAPTLNAACAVRWKINRISTAASWWLIQPLSATPPPISVCALSTLQYSPISTLASQTGTALPKTRQRTTYIGPYWALFLRLVALAFLLFRSSLQSWLME